MYIIVFNVIYNITYFEIYCLIFIIISIATCNLAIENAYKYIRKSRSIAMETCQRDTRRRHKLLQNELSVTLFDASNRVCASQGCTQNTQAALKLLPTYRLGYQL